MNRHISLFAFFLGLFAVVWVAIGYIGGHGIALAVSCAIAAVYLAGAAEMRRYDSNTAALAKALHDIPDDLAHLGAWLQQVPAALQNTVRLRIEGERVALPALMKPSGRDTASFGEEVFRPRRELFLSLASALRDPARLAEASALLHRAPRQRAALEELISALGSDLAGEVPRRLLGADRPMLAALERRGYVTLTERVPDRDGRRETFRLPVLTASQEAALASVGRQFADRETVLLYGVTG